MRSENVFAYTDTDPAAVYPEYVTINKDEAGELSITVRTSTMGGMGYSRLPREKIGALVDALAPYRVDPAGVRSVGTFDAPELRYSFSWALGFLKEGKRVAREGWNGKGMWLAYVHPYAHFGMADAQYEPHTRGATLLPWIGMKTADNGFVPWLASQTDMLADDWCIVEDRADEPELPMFNNDGPWVAQLAAVATDTYAIASDPMRTCQTCKYGSKPSGSHEGCDACMADASRPHWTGCCGKCGACDSPRA